VVDVIADALRREDALGVAQVRGEGLGEWTGDVVVGVLAREQIGRAGVAAVRRFRQGQVHRLGAETLQGGGVLGARSAM
jgi:hypothetical protein